jgi:hypothetical protein
MRLRRDLTLIGAVLAFTLLGGAQAQAARDPLTAPSLLWRTYPLVQDPFSPRYRLHATAVGGVPHPLPARIPEGGRGISSPTLLLLMLASLVAAVAGLLLLRSPLASAGYDWSSTRPRRKRPRKPRDDSSHDMLVALKPSTATPTATRPEPEEDLHEALQPVAAEPASEGDEEPEEQDQAATPVAREVAVDPTEVATERRTAERRKLLPAPRQLDQPVGRPGTGHRSRKKAATSKGAQSCEIKLWHGYFKYQLYASSEGASFALSDSFRLRDEDAPTEAALAELENLITTLETKGWAVVDEGPRWYDLQFERAE